MSPRMKASGSVSVIGDVELGNSAARGGAVTMISQFGKILLQAVGLMMLSRLLTPADFGIVAALTAIVALGELFRDFGLSTAATQTRELTHQQSTNLLWINGGIGLVLAGALVLLSPFLASLFDSPALTSVAPAAAAVFVLNGLQAQYQVLLARNLRFGALVVTDLAAQLFGLGAAILSALLGGGYWSLIIQLLVAQAVLLIGRLVVTGWLPALPRRAAGMRELLFFGAHLGVAQLLGYAAGNADTYTIGARWGTVELGYYNRAFQLLMVPVNQLLAPLTNVALPALSRLSSNGFAFYELLLKAQFAISGILTWMFAMSATLSGEIVEVLLGDQWEQSSSIFGILALGGPFQVLTFIGYWVFLAMGHPRALLVYNLVTKSLVVGFVMVGSAWGLEGVAWGYTLGLAISWPICLLWLGRIAGMPVLRFARAASRALLSGAVTAVACTLLNGELGGLGPVAAMAILIPVSIVLYICVLLMFPGSLGDLRRLRHTVHSLRRGSPELT